MPRSLFMPPRLPGTPRWFAIPTMESWNNPRGRTFAARPVSRRHDEVTVSLTDDKTVNHLSEAKENCPGSSYKLVICRYIYLARRQSPRSRDDGIYRFLFSIASSLGSSNALVSSSFLTVCSGISSHHTSVLPQTHKLPCFTTSSSSAPFSIAWLHQPCLDWPRLGLLHTSLCTVDTENEA